MRLPSTLYRYIAKQFLLSILLVLFGLIAMLMLIDVLELIRRAAGKEHVPFGVILRMMLLKLPYLCERMMPFAVLIGSQLALTRLTRSQELVIARAAGVSVWQFLLAPIALVACLGVISTTLFNPLSSMMLLQFERLEGRYLTGKPSLMSISAGGLWLRQIETRIPGVSEHIIHASRISQQDMSLADLVVFAFDQNGRFSERLDARRAALEPGALRLEDLTRSLPGQPPQPISMLRLPTQLTLQYIQDSFASPETMSFWRLPSFIDMLEKAGFSALRHRLYLQGLLASPLLYVGMVLVAAVFSLRLPRRGRIGLLIAAGVTTGFLLHFFTNIVSALGSAGTLPVGLAAWAPALVMLMLGSALLLHLEDG